mgnify:CR=1 FL=1
MIGHIGFTVFTLGYIAKKFLKIIGIVSGIALIAFAESRAVFVGLIVFSICYHFVLPFARDRKATAFIAVWSFLLLAILLVFSDSIIELVGRWTSFLLGVTDASRNTSDFTGRTDHWNTGIALIEGRELQGYGFRTRGSSRLSEAGLSVNAHSGILNAILDVGVIGTILLFTTFVSTILSLISRWVMTRDSLDRIAVSYLVAMFPVLALEPNYLNFASSSHFLMLLFLTRPLFVPRHQSAQLREALHIYRGPLRKSRTNL